MIPKTQSITKRCKIIIVMNSHIYHFTFLTYINYVKYHEAKAENVKGEKAWTGTEYSSACFAYCRKFISFITSAVPVHSTAFFLSQIFSPLIVPCLRCSYNYAGPRNKSGHPLRWCLKRLVKVLDKMHEILAEPRKSARPPPPFEILKNAL